MDKGDDKLRQMIATTQKSWDERVPIHADDQTGLYDLGSVSSGQDTLSPIENTEIGDISGLKVAHLQCHFGLDTISLARRGATTTGLDYSPSAIEKARELSERAGVETEFVCADVYNALGHLAPETFDLVFVTCGAINWLPDLGPWADVVAKLLKPGGRLYLCDIHPSMAQMEEENGKLVVIYPLSATGPEGALEFNDEESYAGNGTQLQNKKTFEWIHPTEHVLTSLISAGLSIEFFHEHDSLHWKAVPSMVAAPGRMFRLPDGMVGPHLAFSLMAKRH